MVSTEKVKDFKLGSVPYKILHIFFMLKQNVLSILTNTCVRIEISFVIITPLNFIKLSTAVFE